jgi:hypothetical protein
MKSVNRVILQLDNVEPVRQNPETYASVLIRWLPMLVQERLGIYPFYEQIEYIHINISKQRGRYWLSCREGPADFGQLWCPPIQKVKINGEDVQIQSYMDNMIERFAWQVSMCAGIIKVLI